MIRETIKVKDYTRLILEALPRGILLNTQGEKFNSMVINWGFLGSLWGRDCFTAFIREKRYTKKILDEVGEFSLSIPLEGTSPQIMEVCGTKSGRKVDKVLQAGLTLREPRSLNTPGILEYPLTLECKVIYVQKQCLSAMPEDIQRLEYLEAGEAGGGEGVRGLHTQYVGEIMDSYILHE